jgi:nucleotidyltransferase substrate binding protein (TIGR01987 family)
MSKPTSLLNDFQQAVYRLQDALDQPENEYIRDACIQRFEFCFELAWKSIQAVARLHGQECSTPRTAFVMALRNEWISDEAAWLDMLEARNKTSHTYREATAMEVFSELRRFSLNLDELHKTLENELNQINGPKR